MLERIKEIPFIDESAAVKVFTVDGKVVLERNDRVVWAREETNLQAQDLMCYVEADKFFALLEDIEELEQTTCLKVRLKNGAKYELPFLDVEWDAVEMPEDYSSTVTFKLSDLMLCTLKNLVKPELQCIYIDTEGAVSCDFVSACLSKDVKSNEPFLLPPDVQALVDGRMCKVKVSEDKIYIKSADFSVATSRPEASGDAWWESLRGLTQSEDTDFASATKLVDALKRLAMFDQYISFDGEKVIAGDNFEPFDLADVADRQYEIERVSRILTTATKIGVSTETGNLVFKNEKNMFIVSPVEEA